MTNEELLKMLDDDLGERAIKNCIDYHGGENYLTKFGKDVSGALGGAFAWYDTDEGYEFWKKIFFELFCLGLWKPYSYASYYQIVRVISQQKTLEF